MGDIFTSSLFKSCQREGWGSQWLHQLKDGKGIFTMVNCDLHRTYTSTMKHENEGNLFGSLSINQFQVQFYHFRPLYFILPLELSDSPPRRILVSRGRRIEFLRVRAMSRSARGSGSQGAWLNSSSPFRAPPIARMELLAACSMFQRLPRGWVLGCSWGKRW